MLIAPDCFPYCTAHCTIHTIYQKIENWFISISRYSNERQRSMVVNKLCEISAYSHKHIDTHTQAREKLHCKIVQNKAKHTHTHLYSVREIEKKTSATTKITRDKRPVSNRNLNLNPHYARYDFIFDSFSVAIASELFKRVTYSLCLCVCVRVQKEFSVNFKLVKLLCTLIKNFKWKKKIRHVWKISDPKSLRFNWACVC